MNKDQEGKLNNKKEENNNSETWHLKNAEKMAREDGIRLLAEDRKLIRYLRKLKTTAGVEWKYKIIYRVISKELKLKDDEVQNLFHRINLAAYCKYAGLPTPE